MVICIKNITFAAVFWSESELQPRENESTIQLNKQVTHESLCISRSGSTIRRNG